MDIVIHHKSNVIVAGEGLKFWLDFSRDAGAIAIATVEDHAFVLIVPACLVDYFVDLGFRLLDEPTCSGARVLPPNVVSVNRVPANNTCLAPPGKKNARPRLHREPGKKINDNGTESTATRGTQ